MTTVEWERGPFVPVTMTVKLPTVEPVQTSVAVATPLTETEEGVTEQLSPDGETLTVSVTTLLKPFRLIRVIVETAEEPVLKEMLVGLAEIEKSAPALALVTKTPIVISNTITV